VGQSAANSSLFAAHRRAGAGIVLLLVAAAVCFVLGIFRPFTVVTKLWLFDNQVSVYDGLVTLWQAGELFLFLILFVFTICFPAVKLGAMFTLWLHPRLAGADAGKLFHFVAHLGKWSMLDVFVVAILVLTVRSGGVASIQVEDGFFLFFLSVMLTQVASLWTGRVMAR
jgi:paraquat-inducible protein A